MILRLRSHFDEIDGDVAKLLFRRITGEVN